MKLKNITFRQFIETYNFRYCISSDDFNSKIIRIYFGELYHTSEDSNWFEFGVYDWDSNKLQRIERVLSSEILNSYIGSINQSLQDDSIFITLTKEPYKDDNQASQQCGDNITFSE